MLSPISQASYSSFVMYWNNILHYILGYEATVSCLRRSFQVSWNFELYGSRENVHINLSDSDSKMAPQRASLPVFSHGDGHRFTAKHVGKLSTTEDGRIIKPISYQIFIIIILVFLCGIYLFVCLFISTNNFISIYISCLHQLSMTPNTRVQNT